MQADDVALGEQAVEVAVLAVLLEGRGGEGVVGEDVAAEALHDAGGGEADLADAEDADGLAVEGAAEQAVEGEVALADAVVGPVGVAVEGLDQGDGELGDGLGGVGGHVGDHDAVAAGRVEVDIVEAGAAQQDGLDALVGEGVDDGGAQGVVDEDADGVGIVGDEGDAAFVEGELVVDDLDVGVEVENEAVGGGFGGALVGLEGGVQVVPVVGLGAVDGELHGGEID